MARSTQTEGGRRRSRCSVTVPIHSHIPAAAYSVRALARNFWRSDSLPLFPPFCFLKALPAFCVNICFVFPWDAQRDKIQCKHEPKSPFSSPPSPTILLQNWRRKHMDCGHTPNLVISLPMRVYCARSTGEKLLAIVLFTMVSVPSNVFIGCAISSRCFTR